MRVFSQAWGEPNLQSLRIRVESLPTLERFLSEHAAHDQLPKNSSSKISAYACASHAVCSRVVRERDGIDGWQVARMCVLLPSLRRWTGFGGLGSRWVCFVLW